MSVMEMLSKIEELKELEALIREAQAEADKLKEEIKTEMTKNNTEQMSVGRYVVHWTIVSTDRFDSTTFKMKHPDIYDMYIKNTISRRFSISG